MEDLRNPVIAILLTICFILPGCSSSSSDNQASKESNPKKVVVVSGEVAISAESGKEIEIIPPVYTIYSDEDKTVSNYIRRSVKIVVPVGLSEEILEGNMKHAAYAIYDKYKPNAVMVFAYRDDDQNKSAYSAGRCILAPEGEWSKANQRAARGDLKTVIDFASSYFNPIKTIAINSSVELSGDKSNGKIGLSRKADSWDADDVIISVPAGTSAMIIDIRKYMNSGGETVRYQVKVEYKGKEYTGWVHDWQVK